MKRIAVLVAAVVVGLVAITSPVPRPAAATQTTTRPPVPAYTHGAADKMTAYLDFGDRLAGGGIPLTDQEVYLIFYRVAEYLHPSLGITVTTVPPRSRPGEYVTVRILGTASVPWSNEGAIGQANGRMYRNTSWYTTNSVYVGSQGDPEYTAVVAAHETVHKLQPDGLAGHEETPVEGAYLRRNLMSAAPGPGARLSPEMTLAVGLHIEQLRQGWRIGPFLPPQGGQWQFGWHRIN